MYPPGTDNAGCAMRKNSVTGKCCCKACCDRCPDWWEDSSCTVEGTVVAEPGWQNVPMPFNGLVYQQTGFPPTSTGPFGPTPAIPGVVFVQSFASASDFACELINGCMFLTYRFTFQDIWFDFSAGGVGEIRAEWVANFIADACGFDLGGQPGSFALKQDYVLDFATTSGGGPPPGYPAVGSVLPSGFQSCVDVVCV